MQSTIAYANLRAELGRRNMGISDLARIIGMNRTTLSRKLSRQSPLYLDEATRIAKEFPECSDVRYLFSEDSETRAG